MNRFLLIPLRHHSLPGGKEPRDKEGKLEVVQSLCKENPALAKEKDSAGNTPMHWAAFYGHLAVVQFLYELHPPLSEEGSKYGMTPIEHAIENDHHDVVKFLKETGCHLPRDYVE